jgi:hypothetical protein
MERKIINLRQAVRLKCLDCTNNQRNEIENCACGQFCSLWPWRGGRIPREDWKLDHPFLGSFLVKGRKVSEARRAAGKRKSTQLKIARVAKNPSHGNRDSEETASPSSPRTREEKTSGKTQKIGASRP